MLCLSEMRFDLAVLCLLCDECNPWGSPGNLSERLFLRTICEAAADPDRNRAQSGYHWTTFGPFNANQNRFRQFEAASFEVLLALFWMAFGGMV